MAIEPSNSVIRVGVIGLGFGGETHLKCYKQIPNVEVVALAGMEEDKLASLGTTYAVPHLYRYYEELLARDDLDAVSVCVPNFLHAPVALAAFAKGLHVLSEKPLARTGAEAEQISQAAIQAGRVLQVAFNHRRREDIRVLKHYIDDGEIGQIYYAKAHWMRRHGIPGSGTWFVSKEKAGGGPLIDLGVHALDMVLHLLDEPDPVTVSAMTYNEIGKRGGGVDKNAVKSGTGNTFEVEDLATAFLRLSSGATLLLETSWATHSGAGDDFGVTLYGTKGGADIQVKRYSYEDTLRIYLDLAGVPSEIRPRMTRGEGHLGVVRDFIAAICSGNWSAHTGSEGLRRARIIDACYASARLGREVEIG